MRYEVPMRTIYGEASGQSLVLEQAGDEIRLTIDGAFAGRDVDEEISKVALSALLADGPQKNNDLLGLIFETDGGPDVKGHIGVGSGNIGFLVAKSELAAAIDQLS